MTNTGLLISCRAFTTEDLAQFILLSRPLSAMNMALRRGGQGVDFGFAGDQVGRRDESDDRTCSTTSTPAIALSTSVFAALRRWCRRGRR